MASGRLEIIGFFRDPKPWGVSPGGLLSLVLPSAPTARERGWKHMHVDVPVFTSKLPAPPCLPTSCVQVCGYRDQLYILPTGGQPHGRGLEI